MAKDKTKKADTKGKTKAAEKEEPETFKYGVADLAEKLDLEPASVRVKLRNAGIEKAGKSYGWNTKAELQEVIDELKAEKPAKKADTKGKKAKSKDEDDEDDKPAKKSKDKAKKPAKAKKAKDEDDDDDD